MQHGISTALNVLVYQEAAVDQVVSEATRFVDSVLQENSQSMSTSGLQF